MSINNYKQMCILPYAVSYTILFCYRMDSEQTLLTVNESLIISCSGESSYVLVNNKHTIEDVHKITFLLITVKAGCSAHALILAARRK